MLLRSLQRSIPIYHASGFRILGPVSIHRMSSSVPSTTSEAKQEIEEFLRKDLPKPYEGSERDLVNFPRRIRAIEAGKVRLGFIPEEWFQFFYKKTGVTGPYVFGAGLLTYLFSKELWVIEHEFSTGVTMLLMVYFVVKKFGPTTKLYADKLVEEEENRMNKDKEKAMKKFENLIADEKKEQWHAEGQKILMEAKRENVQMQLEAEYRRRMMHVYEQVKKRLDYHMDIYNTRRKLEQTHMVDWVVNSVIKSITPQQEKEALQKCIQDLKTLSAQA